MKKIYSSIFFILLVCCWLNNTCIAQGTWQNVGTNGLVAASAADQAVAVDNKGALYVAYRDEARDFKITTKKFNGTDWVIVGPVGFSVGYVSGVSMAIAPDGTPYVAYTDNGLQAKTIVKKFNGTSWSDVGITGFSATFAYGAALAIDRNNTPYIAFSDFGKSGKATVKKFAGSSWVEVGSAGFSTNHANGITLAIDENNIPYVAYSDNAVNGKATVKKYSAGNWLTVGTVGFTSSYANDISLAITTDGTPCIIYRDEATGYRATAKKYNGTIWADMGNPGFSTGAVRHTTLVTKGNTTYASYIDYGSGMFSNPGTLAVRKFNGTTWENMGPASLTASPGKAFDLKLAIADEGSPYLAYSSESAGWNATVLKLTAPAAPANLAPVANAGTDTTIQLPVNSVKLSGSGTDTDGSVVGYTWRQVSGPKAATFSSTTAAAPVVSNLTDGKYIFGLKVSDNVNAVSAEVIITIVVNPLENVVPLANAGTDKTITLPATSVDLTGSATDSDGEVTAYNWQQVSGPSIALISNTTIAGPTVSALVAGSYVFSLTATDNRNGISAASQVTVLVNLPINLVPVAHAGSDLSITLPQQTAVLDGSGTDRDGTIVAYNWKQVSGPSTVTFSDTAAANATVSNLQVGKYILGLTVTDDRSGRSSNSYVTLTVNEAANILPVANAGADQSITLPISAVSLSGSGSDTDGAIVNYTWSQVSGPNTAILTNATAASPTASGLIAGSYVFSLIVQDDKNGSSTVDQVIVTVKAITTVTVAQQVVTFTLIDADTDKDIMTLTSNAVLDLAKLPTKNLNIRANTNPGRVGSVLFALTGARKFNKTENGAPYALFSDQTGNYNAWVPVLGNYTLKATPYKAASGTGSVGTPLTVAFTVINSTVTPAPVVVEGVLATVQQVVSFTLVNADTDKDIITLTPGATLNLATLPTRNLNIRANTNVNKVGSVSFALTGKQTHNVTESHAPYALFGGDADYKSWTPTVGSYTIKATPYTEAKGQGIRGAGQLVSFTVVDQATTVATAKTVTNAPVVTAYPNPATTKLYVKSADVKDGALTATIYNQTGNVALTQKINTTVSGLLAEINVTNLAAGKYILVLTSTNGVINRQHIVIE